MSHRISRARGSIKADPRLARLPPAKEKASLKLRPLVIKLLRQRIVVAIISLLCFRTSEAFATDCSEKNSFKYRGLTLRVDNDSLDKTDHSYTHGMVAAITYDIDRYYLTDCFALFQMFNSKTETDTTYSMVARIGQSIYTPKDPSRSDLILDDRPYAGLLYIAMSLNQRHNLAERNIDVLDTNEIVLGVIGPLSLAKEFQDKVHDFFGDRKFKGWEHQLNNEPALQFSRERKIKYSRGKQTYIPEFSGDFIGFTGFRLGNIETSANLGVEGRFGTNIPNDFGSYTLYPGTESRPPLSATRLATGLHFFTAIEIKLVAYHFSLDGNLFSSSHKVTRKPWVAYGAMGFNIQSEFMKRGYKLVIMRVYNTSEFEERESHHSYASVVLSIEF